MKKTTIVSLAAVSMALPQLASGEAIVLAGWHEFTANSSTTASENTTANTALPGIIGNVSHLQTSTVPGGSTDGWYGPDSTALGGVSTGQNFSSPTNYDPEGIYAGDTGRFATPYTDPADYTTTIADPNTNFDGRITNAIGTNVSVTNATGSTITLQSFVFDAFMGDVSPAEATAVFKAFTVYIQPISGAPYSADYNVARAYTGVNSVGPLLGDPVDTQFADNSVPNRIDYGTGTNYADYVLDLSGLAFPDGATFTISFQTIGTGTVRLDNLALFAVPEPSSLMLAGLVGSSCFLRRRRRKA